MKKITESFIKFLSSLFVMTEVGSSLTITFPDSEHEKVEADVTGAPMSESALKMAIRQYGTAVHMHAEDEGYKVTDVKFFIERRENSVFTASNFTGETDTPAEKVANPLQVLIRALQGERA